MAVYVFTPPKRRRRTARNFQRMFPDLSARHSRRLARQSFRNNMRTSFDFVWSYAVPQHAMHRHMRAYGVEHAYEAVDQTGGGIFVLASGLQLTTVMGPVGPDLVTRIAVWARRHQEMDVLMSSNAARGLVRAVRRGRFDAILCDLPERGDTVDVDFLGGRVKFSTAPAWVARVTGVPLLPVDCWRYKGLYRLNIHAPVPVDRHESDAVIMQRVADVLARMIRRQPSWWYPFSEIYVDGSAPGAEPQPRA